MYMYMYTEDKSEPPNSFCITVRRPNVWEEAETWTKLACEIPNNEKSFWGFIPSFFFTPCYLLLWKGSQEKNGKEVAVQRIWRRGKRNASVEGDW